MSSKVTVWGLAHVEGGISQTLGMNGHLEGARSIERFELGLPAGGIEVTIGHDPDAVVGDLVYAEMRDRRLNLVAVVDDWVAGVEEPVYYSGEWDCRGRADDLHGDMWTAERAYLIGLALVTNPGSLEAQPLRFKAGDVRSSRDRYGWPLSWRSDAPLLERAVARLPARTETRASRIVPPPPEVVEVRGEDGTRAYLVDDELVASSGRPFGELELRAPASWSDDRRPVGELRRGPRGRILSVR